MARTIDNLGIDTSNRYAEDKALYDESIALIKEAGTIPSQTKITVTLPSYKSEFDLLFDVEKKQAPWALFEAPTGYRTSRLRLFAEQLIPRLGSPDLQEAKISRLETLGKDEPESEAAKERQIISTLLNKVHLLDGLLIDTNSKRAQYQKG